MVVTFSLSQAAIENNHEKEMKNPYEVRGAKSETRWKQPQAELFGPVPCSVAHVAISTGGKTSQMLTIADALFPVMDRVVIFSHSHRLDPAFGNLKQKIEPEVEEKQIFSS